MLIFYFGCGIAYAARTDGGGGSGGGSAADGTGYAVEPATVTFLLDKGFRSSTGTFTSLSPGVMHVIAGSSNVTTGLVSMSTETSGAFISSVNVNASLTVTANGANNTVIALTVDPSSGTLLGPGITLGTETDGVYVASVTVSSAFSLTGTNNVESAAPIFSANSSSITLQGNTFNGANQLLQADSSGLIPNADIDSSSITKLGPSITLDEVQGGSSGANAYDFGGATSLEMPNGTSPTVDATGEFAVDTSSAQLVWYDGTNALVIPSTFSKHMTIGNPVAGDFPFFWKAHNDITLLYAVCLSSANTTTISLSECNSDGSGCSLLTSTTTSCGTTETNLVLTDTSIAAGNRIRTKVEVETDPNWMAIDVWYRETRK